MNVNFKNIEKTLLVTLLVVSASTFCVFPKTNSKYYTFKDVNTDPHLKYNVRYETIKKGEIKLNVDAGTSSAPNTLGLIGSFNRSNYGLSTDESVEYTLTVDSACTINSTTASDNKKATLTKSGNTATLTFNKSHIDDYLNEGIEVSYTCNADSNVIHKGNVLQSTFRVKERFNSESKTYDLGNKTISLDYNSFLSTVLVPYIKDGIVYIPKTYKDSFYTYIDENYISDREEPYFNKKYNNDSDLIADKSLKGFSITSNDKYYIYKKDKNFDSYAYTYYDFKDGIYDGKYFWFRDKNATLDELLSLFREYLDLYTDYTNQKKDDLIAYIRNSNVSFDELLNCTDGSKEIKGLSHGGSRQISIKDSIWFYVYPQTNIEISYQTAQNSTQLTQIINSSTGQFESVFGAMLSKTNKTSIRGKIKSVLRTTPTIETYTYLEPFNDGTQTVVVLVHSIPTGDVSTSIHRIDIYEVTPNKLYSLSFNEAATSTETAVNINKVLEPFNVSITEDMLSNDPTGMVTKNGNIYTVEFTAKEAPVQNADTESSSTETSGNDDSVIPEDDSIKSEGQTNNETQENQENSLM